MISPMSIHGGIDLGGTKIQAAIVDDDHDVLGSARRATPTSGGPADVAAEMEAALRDAAASAGVEIAALAGVGVGSPGTIEGSSVRSARNLPGWEGSFPLGETLQAALGCEVRVGNDVQVANSAAVATCTSLPTRTSHPSAACSGTALPLAAGSVLGDRRRWRADHRRPGVARARRRR